VSSPKFCIPGLDVREHGGGERAAMVGSRVQYARGNMKVTAGLDAARLTYAVILKFGGIKTGNIVHEERWDNTVDAPQLFEVRLSTYR